MYHSMNGGHGGGGGHHGGGGGGHHGGGGRGGNVFVQGGGYGPGWWDGGYPDVVYVEPPCAITDAAGNCVCRSVDRNGVCIGLSGMGDDAASMGSSTSWITGGLIILAAIGVFAIDKKGPAPLRRASS